MLHQWQYIKIIKDTNSTKRFFAQRRHIKINKEATLSSLFEESVASCLSLVVTDDAGSIDLPEKEEKSAVAFAADPNTYIILAQLILATLVQPIF